MSKIFSAVFDEVAKPVTVAVGEAIKGLVAANETLTSGGIKLPTLHYEQARDLVAAVSRISGRPVVLFLDQWEKSPAAKVESHTLDAFLRHLNDWPGCHIIMALTPDELAAPPEARRYRIVEDLTKRWSGKAELYNLQLLDLKDDSARDGLLSFLSWHVPAVRGVPEQQLLTFIDGFPGVIEQWTNKREAMQSAEDLERVAAGAHKYHFEELNDLLPKLPSDTRRLAARLALLPVAAEPEVWTDIKPQVCDGLNAEILDDLRLGNVLESAEPPSFGHPKRWDAARSWFVENRKNTIKPEVEALILAFASRIRHTGFNILSPLAALIDLQATDPNLDLPALHRGLCEAAATLFLVPSDANTILRGARAASSEPRAAPLMAMGLVNALNFANREGDLARRDAMLRELRSLARSHANNEAVRENLAIGLFNTLNYARSGSELGHRNALLHELRALSQAHGQDATVLEWFAKGLFNTLNDANADSDLDCRDAMLDELRALARAHNDATSVREQLAMALVNMLDHVKVERNLGRRDTLLEELRALARSHVQDEAVREQLAVGLFNAGNDAKAENDLRRRDALLEELRALGRGHDDDASVRKRLAKGLFNTLIAAKAENDLARRDALLKELRALAQAHGEDAAVRERLAVGLFNTLNAAKAENDLARRDALLDELRALYRAYGEDERVSEWFAKALFNTLNDANAESDVVQRNALLGELRALARAHDDDANFRGVLAVSLFSTLDSAKAEDNLALRDALLAELRALAWAHGDDTTVRELLAMGLFNTLDAMADDDFGRCEELLEELRALVEGYPDDPFLQEVRRQLVEAMRADD